MATDPFDAAGQGDAIGSEYTAVVTDQSPPPGARAQPKPLERRKFLEYRAPPDGTCKPLPSAPAEPIARTAPR